MGEGRRQDGDRAGIRRRLTVPEAAAEIGTTSEGVRSRIKRGTLETERESGRVWVILEGAPPRPDAAPPGPDAAQMGDRAELVEELRARVAFLEGEIERRGASEAELRRIIAALTSRIPEIEAPRQEPPERGEPDAEPVHGEEPVPREEPHSRVPSQGIDSPRQAGFLPAVTAKVPFREYAIGVTVPIAWLAVGTLLTINWWGLPFFVSNFAQTLLYRFIPYEALFFFLVCGWALGSVSSG